MIFYHYLFEKPNTPTAEGGPLKYVVYEAPQYFLGTLMDKVIKLLPPINEIQMRFIKKMNKKTIYCTPFKKIYEHMNKIIINAQTRRNKTLFFFMHLSHYTFLMTFLVNLA